MIGTYEYPIFTEQAGNMKALGRAVVGACDVFWNILDFYHKLMFWVTKKAGRIPSVLRLEDGYII